MDPDQQLRNLRDFLLVYNRMTEICFQRCTSNFNYRNLTMDEERCVDSCAGKLIRSNHRLMGTYVQLMPRMVQRRMEEMESKAAENAKAAEAAAAAAAAAEATTASSEAVGSATTEASPSPAFQTPTSSLNPQIPSLVTPPVTDVGAEVNGSVLKPTLDFTTEVDAAVSKSTEVTLSAATPHTPMTEAVNSSVLNTTGTEPSFTSGFPLPPITGSHIDSECSPPLLPPNLTALPEDVPVLTAAPTVSKSESLSVQEKTPDLPPPSGQ